MSYLQHGVPMSIADMEGILKLIDQADASEYSTREFLKRMKVLFATAIKEAKGKESQYSATFHSSAENA